MNRLTLVPPAATRQPAVPELQALEREARRLRAEYARDLLTSVAIGLDLRLRRLAYRVAARLRPGETLRPTRRCNV